MIFSKKKSVETMKELDDREIDELEKLMYYLLAYKQYVRVIRSFNLELYLDISNERHLGFEGEINEVYMESFEEDIKIISSDFKKLKDHPYTMKKSNKELLNTKNKWHFIHLSHLTLNDIASSINQLNKFFEEYLFTVKKIYTTKDFTLQENIPMEKLINNSDFLDFDIEEIENYLKSIK